MARIFGLTIGMLLILHQLQNGVAFDAISIASTAIKFGKSAYDMYKMLFEDKSADDVALLVKNFNQDIQNDMTRVVDILKDLPSIIRLELKKETLEGHFALIGQIFEEASRIKKEIDDGIIDRNNSKYERFALKEKDIDHSIYEIRRILTDDESTLVLKQKFIEVSKKFYNVCKIGMSHLQLLDSLLSNLKIATLQYYLSKKFMYEFLELKGEDNSNAKQTLLNNVNMDYSNAVKKFKDVMSTASVELWTCDPPVGSNDVVRHRRNSRGRINIVSNGTDAVRYCKNRVSTYTAVRYISKYYLNEDSFVPFGDQCTKKKCNSITKLEKCKMIDHFCNKVRLCPGKLLACKQYTKFYPQNKVNVCTNNDKNAYNRYLSVVPANEPSENFHCGKEGSKYPLFSIPFGFYQVYSSCDYCDCLCEEDEYFIDERFIMADVELNKVVTGARFVMEDKTLRIQIQQAKLMANGIIDKSTLEWKPSRPIDKKSRVKISIEEYNKFVLTPVLNTDGGVVVSITLKTNQDDKLVYLHVGTAGVDFKSGILDKNYFGMTFRTGDEPTQKYDMTGRDVSTKSRKENKPDSTEEQHVELTLTSLAKDGGQTVIPFIDTQSITANGPLSGASLYIRGQPGFGGFLGIKLYTYDIRKYVDVYAEI